MNLIHLGTEYNNKGKAGTLNSLFNKFNICKGFIITDKLFMLFLKYNNIIINNYNDLKAIQNSILNGTLKEEWEKEIFQYLKTYKLDKVIVRSSANVEDGKLSAFSGQFDTFTNIDENNLISSIKKCWASLYSRNVIEYMKEKKLDFSNLSMEVLIQEMIDSDYSGIAFSLNPTNNKKETIIEINKGSCENIVSGKTIPNTYINNNKIKGDTIIDKDSLNKINQTIHDLKKIFNYELEIEFGFKDNIFYLFQVRPITKSCFSITDYIQNEFWCSFKNNNRSLYNRSLWILGATKYKHKKINNNVTEDITIFYPHNILQLRGFNGTQTPIDSITLKRHKQEDISHYIDNYNTIYNKVLSTSKSIKNNIKDDDYSTFITNLKRLIKYEALIYSYEYLINALGQKLYNNLNKEIFKKLELWKNDPSNNYKIYENIFSYIRKKKKIKISPYKFKEYLHVNEILNLCNNKLSNKTIINRINRREQNGFVLLNINNTKFTNKLIENKKDIEKIKKRLEQLQLQPMNEKNNENLINGSSTFKNGKIIKGECVVIKDNSSNIKDLNLKNKILVCQVTTAKDVLYLKKVKALIVDNGGILCHSAIFSREFKIPCLMGCNIATKMIIDGDIIEYDIDKELVKIVN